MRLLCMKSGILMLALGLTCLSAFSQDTVQISLQSAKKQFLEKNLLLIGEKYNIDIAKAEVIQAKLFDNPTFSTGIDIMNPDNKKWFDATKSTGQYTFGIEQVIRLGGKRNKQIDVAKLGVQLSENQFYDLMRTLRFTLTGIFYDVYYTQQSLQAFDNQIELLKNLQKNYQELQKKGVVPLSEVVRIQSLLYSIQSDQLDFKSVFNEKEAQLQLLLQDNQTIYIPTIDTLDFAFTNTNSLLVNQLIDEARDNRVDLLQSKNELSLRKKNIDLQKSLAIPDITLAADYDKQGNFTNNLFTVGVSIDLPFFNRNQGNIRAAKASAMQGEVLLQQKQLEIDTEVKKTYLNARDADKANQSIQPQFESDLNLLLHSITDNFKKRNIGLLEFTDFYESYRDNIIKINQIRNRKAQAMEELRFVVGN